MYSDTTSTCIHCMGPLTRQKVWVSLVCENVQEVSGGIIYWQLRLPAPLSRQNVWVSLVCESIQEVPGGIIYCQLRLPQSSLSIQMYSDTIVWAPSADKSLQSKLQGCFSASCSRTVLTEGCITIGTCAEWTKTIQCAMYVCVCVCVCVCCLILLSWGMQQVLH